MSLYEFRIDCSSPHRVMPEQQCVQEFLTVELIDMFCFLGFFFVFFFFGFVLRWFSFC